MSNLKSQVMGGLAWSVVSKFVTQVFSWVSTFFVIRLLTPEDYGVMAIAAVFFMLVTMFTTGGFSSAVVNEQKRCSRTSNLIFSLSLIVNIVLTSIIVLSASFIADWYNNEDLVMVLWTMAAINPVNSFIVIPAAHLQMEMRFKEKAVVESVAGILGAITAIALAYYLETGYWALVYSTVVMTIVRGLGFNIMAKSKYRPTLNFKGAKALFTFALHLQMGGFVWFFYTRADTVILGKFLGLEKTGIYNVANEVASIPMNKVMMIMNDVAFAAFNKIKSDSKAAKEYLEKALRLMAVVAFPVFYGISSISNEIVYVLLGEKWAEAGPIIALFAILIPFRMINILLNNFITGMGETKFGFHNALITAFFLISALLIGGPHGLMIAAISWACSYAVALAIMYWRFLRKFELKLSYLSVLVFPFITSAIMLVGLNTVGSLLANQTAYVLSHWEMMIIKIVIGASMLGPILIRIYGQEIRALFKK